MSAQIIHLPAYHCKARLQQKTTLVYPQTTEFSGQAEIIKVV